MEKENLNFQESVIDRSSEVPVLVDFWSPTCGPCLFLGPVLEKLEKEAEGKWELVKVNTMFNQQLAMEWNISSIPAVKLFHKGKVVNEFVGALPEGILRKWLDEFLPDERKEELAGIMETMMTDSTLGLAKLRGFVDANPDLSIGRLQLAGAIMFEQPEEAVELVSTIKEGELLYENAQNVRFLAEMMSYQGDAGEVSELLGKVRDSLREQDFDTALENVVEAVVVDKNHQDELPRRGSIALFRLLGMQHPLTNKYRKKFEMALY